MGMESPDTRPSWADDSCWDGAARPRRGGSVSLPAGGGFFVARDHDEGNRVTVIERPGSALGQIPKRVRALGLVPMLMVISSEMIHALLPLFFRHGSRHLDGDRRPYRRNRSSHGAALPAFGGVALIGARMQRSRLAKVAVE
jgi:hypothetical protein